MYGCVVKHFVSLRYRSGRKGYLKNTTVHLRLLDSYECIQSRRIEYNTRSFHLRNKTAGTHEFTRLKRDLYGIILHII